MFLGHPDGLTFGPWDIAVLLPPPLEHYNGTDIRFRLVQMNTSPEREFSYTWEPGRESRIVPSKGIERSLVVTDDGPAMLLELAVIPVSDE